MQADETMTKQESEEMVLSQRAARYASAILFGEGMKFVRTVFH